MSNSSHSVPNVATSKRRKRVKTFTGCWTCRARKVKCDESRPICNQCSSKNLDCEGYDVRLRWMTPESGPCFSNHSKPLSPQLPPAKYQRSRILAESAPSPLQLAEVDDILFCIDEFSTRRVSNQFLLSHFGVFSVSSAQVETDENNTHDNDVFDYDNVSFSSPIQSLDDTGVSAAADGWLPNDLKQTSDAPLTVSFASLESYDPILNLAESDSITNTGHSAESNLHPATPPRTDDAASQRSTSHAEVSQEDASQHHDIFHTQPHHLFWENTNGTIIRNPPPVHMSNLERFLMYHYTHRVVHLFCVIDNNKSPWKTIHLPRVLQSTGQLSMGGKTSATLDALKNALLSISAFYLSNESKSRSCHDEALRWSNDAMVFRGRALKLLKDTVEGNSASQSPPKYKELLATMLSMITINVMSGDNSTCGIHLDGAFRFMSHARGWKSRYSPKASSLHRIYLYLRVIYQSTALKSPGKAPILGMTTPEAEARLLSEPAWDVSSLLDAPSPPVLSHITAPGTFMNTYECIYGVPQSLLVLLARATDLINQVMDARGGTGMAGFVPHELEGLCDDLEMSILNWDSEVDFLDRFADNDDGTSSEIIRKTTLAFHHALIIYFAQHVRLIRHGYLKPNVQVVLSSIEAIEQLKAETRILAAPLYWPAFIAGSEAFDQGLQGRFKEWYTQVEPYGIASVRTGISVLNEVWSEGPSAENKITSRWRTVVERTGSVLMLS